ncbi:hypothetical protein NDU88_003243 [Pleurodeles waltl]|uniref:Uncharacterized protein n=1 Tax=Pleurodeles waltl TaxID=8319 RepID=A0AAV7MRP6_PLEWA|nr:hypothetical protein NDU88_003243 [Pleurodeles waltl]
MGRERALEDENERGGYKRGERRRMAGGRGSIKGGSGVERREPEVGREMSRCRMKSREAAIGKDSRGDRRGKKEVGADTMQWGRQMRRARTGKGRGYGNERGEDDQEPEG